MNLCSPRAVVGSATFAAVLGWTALSAQETTPGIAPPSSLTVAQVSYGATAPTVLLGWSNQDAYTAIEARVDDVPAAGAIDGSAVSARVGAAPGEHVFSIRGVVGNRASAPVSVPFTVLAATPVAEPITDLDCEFVPGAGGTLRLDWTQGTDAWVEGRLEVPGRTGAVRVPAGATSATIAAPETSPRVASIAFRNADGYFSEPALPICSTRTPAFLRGDCNGDGRVGFVDAIVELNVLFLDSPRWRCDDACDVNDDGEIGLSDPIHLLEYLFLEGPMPTAPGPLSCGIDATEDFLGGICDGCR